MAKWLLCGRRGRERENEDPELQQPVGAELGGEHFRQIVERRGLHFVEIEKARHRSKRRGQEAVDVADRFGRVISAFLV